MFVHAPEKPQTAVFALVLWDDPDLAFRAVGMCREIESRSGEVKFRIEEVAAADLEWKGEEFRTKACEADLLILAFHKSVQQTPAWLRDWFFGWSRARERQRQAGALGVLRAADHVDSEQLHQVVQEGEEPFRSDSQLEEEFRRFLEECASHAHMELFWGCLESDLEEATRGMRILEAPDPNYPGERNPEAA